MSALSETCVVFPTSFTKFKSLSWEQALRGHRIFHPGPTWDENANTPRGIKHNKLPLTEHKYDTPAHVSSLQFPFNIQIPYDTNRGKGHHPSCTKLPSFSLSLSACLHWSQAALHDTCHSHAILPKASGKQDPSVIYNGGAHFITNWLGSQPRGQTITSAWG